MPRPLGIDTLKAISDTLTSAGYTWEDFTAYFTSAAPVSAAAEPKPDKSDVDSKFVHTACEAIINAQANGGCKLTRGGKEFVIQLRERASTYKSVRFSPKQWSWFNSIMVDAGVEAIEAPSDPYLQR